MSNATPDITTPGFFRKLLPFRKPNATKEPHNTELPRPLIGSESAVLAIGVPANDYKTRDVLLQWWDASTPKTMEALIKERSESKDSVRIHRSGVEVNSTEDEYEMWLKYKESGPMWQADEAAYQASRQAGAVELAKDAIFGKLRIVLHTNKPYDRNDLTIVKEMSLFGTNDKFFAHITGLLPQTMTVAQGMAQLFAMFPPRSIPGEILPTQDIPEIP